MIVRILILSFIVISEAPAVAETSFIGSAYTQVKHQRFCGLVTADEVRKANLPCVNNDQLKNLQRFPSQIYEWAVFQEAAEIQMKKNICANSQLRRLRTEDDKASGHPLKEIWASQLAASWLGVRKAELILAKCGPILSKIDPKEEKELGINKAYERATKRQLFGENKPLDEKWKRICMDRNQLNTLAAAKGMFVYSLPVVSSEKFFDIMGKNRNSLINKKTGKAFTDEEILAADLSADDINLRLDYTNKFDQDLKNEFDRESTEKFKLTNEILKSKNKNGYDLSDAVKNYIFEDGTVNQVLLDKKEIGPDFKELSRPGELPVSNGAFCLISRYEATPVGETINFAATSMIAGGLITKLIKLPSVAASLSGSTRAMLSSAGGPTAAGGIQIAKIYSACETGTYQARKVKNAGKSEMAVYEKADEKLPRELGFSRISLDMSDDPNCEGVEAKNLILTDNTASCVRDSLLNVAPLKVALPLMAL